MENVHTKQIINNLPFHSIIEREVEKTPFGTLTVNVILKNGVCDLKTLNIVKNRRKKYQFDKNDID